MLPPPLSLLVLALSLGLSWHSVSFLLSYFVYKNQEESDGRPLEGGVGRLERKIILKLLHDKPMMLSSLERDDREVLRDLMDLLEEYQTGRNLTREEQQAINDLKNNKDFLIKEADKGGNVVLWPLEKYICEALRQLNDRNYYQQLPSDPTDYFQRKFIHIFDSALEHGVISKKELEYLQPLVTALPSYLRDSLHLMQIIKNIQIPKGTLLVTCDVESLYSNIRHQDGIRAITYYLEQQVHRKNVWNLFLFSIRTTLM
ncbi:uncharacterized protein LOC130282653 isoform X2 [Hyla sarda]|uniref:uncharacterized protein LOC130282653 isoform X2 n=1 Tax=Hyla sarda TaxID=327740 RepID=UPI0024C3B5F1|nr:uncharacterized protein LOC130282653 isoform X2 [Hyla sarda]